MAEAARAAMNGQWGDRLSDFNVRVARIAHRSWIPENVQPLVFDAQGALHPRAEKWISEWLLETHDLLHEMDWQMKEPQKRIWLLDSASLMRLTRELSTVMHRHFLLRTIDGPRLRDLRSRIDPVLWRLMVEEMPSDAPGHDQARVHFLNREPADLEAELIADGSQTLLALLAPEWRAVCGRARLRFAANQSVGAMNDPSAADRVLALVCGWLVPRRLPQWAWLF
jgi:hypothetical protein